MLAANWSFRSKELKIDSAFEAGLINNEWLGKKKHVKTYNLPLEETNNDKHTQNAMLSCTVHSLIMDGKAASGLCLNCLQYSFAEHRCSLLLTVSVSFAQNRWFFTLKRHLQKSITCKCLPSKCVSMSFFSSGIQITRCMCTFQSVTGQEGKSLNASGHHVGAYFGSLVNSMAATMLGVCGSQRVFWGSERLEVC